MGGWSLVAVIKPKEDLEGGYWGRGQGDRSRVRAGFFFKFKTG
jgi:hypothetical protein